MDLADFINTREPSTKQHDTNPNKLNYSYLHDIITYFRGLKTKTNRQVLFHNKAIAIKR